MTRLERRRLVHDLHARQHPVDDVAFDRERPGTRSAARAFRSASARPRRAARRSGRPRRRSARTCSGFAARSCVAHELADDEAERHAILGLRPRTCPGVELDVLGLHALLLQVVAPSAPSSAAPRRRRSDLRQRERRLRAQRAEHLLLDEALELALELELQVRFDLGAQVVERPLAMPNARRERVVERRQRRRAFTSFTSSVNCAVFPATSLPW